MISKTNKAKMREKKHNEKTAAVFTQNKIILMYFMLTVENIYVLFVHLKHRHKNQGK